MFRGYVSFRECILQQSITYCWRFRNPVNSPVEVGSLSQYLRVVVWEFWTINSIDGNHFNKTLKNLKASSSSHVPYLRVTEKQNVLPHGGENKMRQVLEACRWLSQGSPAVRKNPLWFLWAALSWLFKQSLGYNPCKYMSAKKTLHLHT